MRLGQSLSNIQDPSRRPKFSELRKKFIFHLETAGEGKFSELRKFSRASVNLEESLGGSGSFDITSLGHWIDPPLDATARNFTLHPLDDFKSLIEV